MPRFFSDPLQLRALGDQFALSADEAHHLRDVLRIPVGAEVELFDGRGGHARAEVVAAGKRGVDVQLSTSPESDPYPAQEVWLVFAPPKADRLRWLVEKCTELGVDRLTPIITERAVVKPGEGKLRKLEDAALQACKQCGRNRLPAIMTPQTWSEFWRQVAATDDNDGARWFIADRSGVPVPSALSADDRMRPGKIILLVGPEGGFTEPELQQAQAAGAQTLSLGTHILRIETAAVAGVACLRTCLSGC
ncbi:MAG: 16S rRNA (uracil(1498)-N(3))-methyltransferase [Planctomycetaceae bacterium]|nr:16S rRNA (uracil(1498)-N(3))-methyltransferase [Planctomycetaceae bacterium]